MKYNDYYELVKKHLAQYKVKNLKIMEDGVYKRNNKQYAHILPELLKYQNILLTYRDDIISYLQENKIKLHNDFHHLNSSQALCLNLFSPFCITNNLSLILQIMGIDDSIVSYSFEYIQDKKEYTNFDFFINGKKYNYYFEVKYTEQKYDDESMDESHIKKYESIYKEKLREIGNIDIKLFFENYQIFRNIINAKNDKVIFVLPKQREDMIEKINSIKKIVNCSQNIYILTLEEIVNISRYSNNDKLKSNYIEFKEKYLTTAST